MMTLCQACEFQLADAIACDCGALLCPFCRAEHECVADTPELTLRAYQLAMVRATNEALRTRQRVITVAPTGSGKRYVGVWYSREIQKRGRRVLFATDRRLLVQQFFDDLKLFGVEYGVIMAGQPKWDTPTVQVASIQTLQSRYLRTGEGLPEADWLIIDEAHKMPKAYCRLFELYPRAKVMGLTATPVGPQGRSLIHDGYYESLVEGVLASRLIHEKYLLPTRVFAPSEPDIKGVNVNSGCEYNQAELSERVEGCTVFGDVYREWEKFRDRQAILFVPGVKYCYGLAEQFNRRYGDGTAAVIEGGTGPKDRTELLKRFDDETLSILVSVDVLKEGFDCSASLGIDLQPNHQLRTYVQKVGRIRRPRGTHQNAVWIDMAGNYWRFPHPDEDIAWSEVTGDQTTQDMLERRRKEKGESEPGRCPGCGEVPLRWAEGRCPLCGFVPGKPKRYVRMGNGKVKEVPIEHKIKTQKSHDQAAWDKARYIAHYTGRTLWQAKLFFKQQTGRWPPDGLNYMPERDSLDWQRKPSAVYPWMLKRKSRKPADSIT